MSQGDIWMMEPVEGKRRPVLIVTRDAIISSLSTVVVAPITTRMRSIPTCVPIGTEHGIHRDSVASFDNLTAIPKSVLTRRIGDLGTEKRQTICRALSAMANC